ncbi:MAG: hypothetical protein QOF78_1955 [Phycisphaerales bacterium]|nr:hypothetical protein [Phycisphaerales bacterium]
MFASEPLEARRFLSAGDLDPTFGSGGTSRIDFNWANGYNLVNQRMPDGKLLIGGNIGGQLGGGGNGTLVLGRLNPDGSVDTTFGLAGQLDTGILAQGQDVSVHPTTGKIAIAAKSATADEINVAVLSADGVPDSSFDGDGRRVMTFPRNDTTNMHVAWQGDRLILAAADDLSGTEADAHLVVMRLNANGSTDNSFGSGGQHFIAHEVTAGNDIGERRTLHEMDVLADGRIVITSSFNDGDFTAADAFRLTADGDTDTTYGGGDGAAGIYGVTNGPENDEGGYLIDSHVGPDGTVYGMWNRYSIAEWHASVTRLDAAGVSLGNVALGFGTNDGPTDVAFDAAGRIYVAGLAGSFPNDTTYDLFATRFNVQPHPEPRPYLDPWIGVRDTAYGVDGFARAVSGTAWTFAARYEDDGAATFVGPPGGLGSTAPKQLQVVRVLGAVPDVVLNRKGSLIVNTDVTAEQVSLSIRGRDGRLIVRVGDFAKSFAPSRVKRVALFTSGGDDVITIGDGVKGSYVDAGDGNDTLNGGQGDDALLGGGGKDKIYGFDGNDKLLGGASNDYLLGGAGKDDLFGQGGLDTLSGAGSNDRLFGGAGTDRCLGGPGSDSAANSDEDTYDSIETLLDAP